LFWLVHYVKIITLLLSPKNAIDAVQSEGNLNQIESLRRKMTIIGNGHVGIWAWHMTWRAKWNLGLPHVKDWHAVVLYRWTCL